MKKLTTILVALIYLVISTGFVVNIHYCMGDIAEIVIGHAPDNDLCPRCGMDNDGCCKDETLVIKYGDSQALVKNTVDGFKADVKLNSLQIPVIPQKTSFTLASFSEYIPPEFTIISLCILHSVFRI